MSFDVLRAAEQDAVDFFPAAEHHLAYLQRLKANFVGKVGETFIGKIVGAFAATGSPYVVNLDRNVSGAVDQYTTPEQLRAEAKATYNQIQTIVRATAGHALGFKMNTQSELTCLAAGEIRFVADLKNIYAEECRRRFGMAVVPPIWLDFKEADIPHTNYEVAKIHFALGYDAVHGMPQIGPDVVGAIQVAAQEMGGRGVVHVINMTHPGYGWTKENLLRQGAIDKMRRNALGGTQVQVDLGKKDKNPTIELRATTTIEPANRPYELFQGRQTIYGENIMILSIGIGPQGATPGCALYAGATLEGVGRFIFRGKEGLDTPENINQKARAIKRAALRAIGAAAQKAPYPVEAVLKELEGFKPELAAQTKEGLDAIYAAIKS